MALNRVVGVSGGGMEECPLHRQLKALKEDSISRNETSIDTAKERLQEVQEELSTPKGLSLPLLAGEIGVDIGGLDLPRKRPVVLTPLYEVANITRLGGQTSFTICMGMNGYPDDILHLATSEGNGDAKPEIHAFWKMPDGSEFKPTTVRYPLGITSWLKLQIRFLKGGEEPVLLMSAIQQSTLTSAGRQRAR